MLLSVSEYEWELAFLCYCPHTSRGWAFSLFHVFYCLPKKSFIKSYFLDEKWQLCKYHIEMEISQILSQNTDEHNTSWLSQHNLIHQSWCFDCSWCIVLVGWNVGYLERSFWNLVFHFYWVNNVWLAQYLQRNLLVIWHCTMKAHNDKKYVVCTYRSFCCKWMIGLDVYWEIWLQVWQKQAQAI